MIWLHFFGHEGMTVESQRETLHTCKGLLNLARDRVTNASNSIRGDWIHWTDTVKRKAIARGLNKNSSSQTVWQLWMEHCYHWDLNQTVLIKQTIMAANMFIALLVTFCVMTNAGSKNI